MDTIPVVIVHIGDSYYLRDVVEINAVKNPVIVIGCEKNAYLSEIQNVRHICYKKYLTPYAEHMREHFYVLEKGIDTTLLNDVDPEFKNMTSGTCQFLWMLRVYLVKQFMEEERLSLVFHIDSDCLMLENTKELAYYLQLDGKSAIVVEHIHDDIHMVASIHNAFLTPAFCNSFLQLYEDVYVNKTKRYLFKTKADAISSGRAWGNICDMNFYYLLWREHLIDVVDLTMPFFYRGEHCVFDHNIKNPTGFEGPRTYKMTRDEKGDRKDIWPEEGKLYQETHSGKVIRLLSLHFNDTAKERISSMKGLFLN